MYDFGGVETERTTEKNKLAMRKENIDSVSDKWTICECVQCAFMRIVMQHKLNKYGGS